MPAIGSGMSPRLARVEGNEGITPARSKRPAAAMAVRQTWRPGGTPKVGADAPEKGDWA